MKKLRKCLAVLLVLSLVFTMAVPTFADNAQDLKTPPPSNVYSEGNCKNGEFNYICFGDSMTNGYGLPGYDDSSLGEKNPTMHDGFNYVVKGMYPDLVAQELNKNYGYKVNLFQYAFTATRLEDVLALLSTDDINDPNYFGGDAFTDYYIIKCRIDRLFGAEAGSTPNEKFVYAKKYIQAAVKDADLISVCLGMNTFVCFLRDRLNEWSDGALGEDRTGKDAYHLDTVLSAEGNALYEKLENALLKVLKKQLGDNSEVSPEMVCGILNDLIYSFASFGDGYNKFANRIYELNPDADLLLIGFPYGAKDVYASVSVPIGNKKVSVDLNVGKMIEALFDVINVYIYNRAVAYKGDSAYVDYGDTELIFEEIANLTIGGKVNFADNDETIVFTGANESMMREIGSKFVDAIAGESSGQQLEFNNENIKKGVAYIQGESEGAADCALVGEVYLGIRDAIIDVLNYNDENRYNYIELEKMLPYILNQDESVNKLLDSSVVSELKAVYSAETGGQGGSASLRQKVSEILKKDGIQDFVFFYARTFMGNGHAAHTSLEGHNTEAEKILTSYTKLQQKKKTKTIIKKAIPLLVGGATVALITASAATVIKNKASASDSLENGTLSTDSTVSDNNFVTKIKTLVSSAKSYFSSIIQKFMDNKTYEISYIEQ